MWLWKAEAISPFAFQEIMHADLSCTALLCDEQCSPLLQTQQRSSLRAAPRQASLMHVDS